MFVGRGFRVVVWRRATFPHPVGWSIIAVPGLSFQVRNGAGRFPWAMAATSLSVMRPHRVVGVVWLSGDRMVDAACDRV